jgi:putative aldouronate transport system permease protein
LYKKVFGNGGIGMDTVIRKKRKRRSLEDYFVDIFSYAVLGIYAIIVLLPVMNLVFKAVSEDWAVNAGKVGLMPVGFQLRTMRYVIDSAQFLSSFSISVIMTVVGTAGAIILTCLTAYPLSKKHVKGMKPILIIFVFTMLFSGGIIPNYLLIKNLGLLNNFFALVLPSMFSVFNMLVMKNYFESLPESLEESAKLDGASNIAILFKIILPISLPVLATVSLFYAVSYWNDYFNAMLYINRPNLKPLQLYLRDIVMSAMDPVSNVQLNAEELMNLSTEGVRSATVVASMVPMIMVYPWLQKYFIKGMLIGSVKE